jgi:hypothetical protein
VGSSVKIRISLKANTIRNWGIPKGWIDEETPKPYISFSYPLFFNLILIQRTASILSSKLCSKVDPHASELIKKTQAQNLLLSLKMGHLAQTITSQL